MNTNSARAEQPTFVASQSTSFIFGAALKLYILLALKTQAPLQRVMNSCPLTYLSISLSLVIEFWPLMLAWLVYTIKTLN